ncbi:MAG TPA: glycosyltransferase [Phycisphaerales bacterium]|nr:glycosyltransferase [Phycisphaerales bacterium]
MLVVVVIPCFDRQHDLTTVLHDLAALDLGPAQARLGVRVVVVDNASARPLEAPAAHPFALEVIRLPTNTGGSGGFNAGIARALSLFDAQPDHPAHELIWLLDSDARPCPDALGRLVAALLGDPTLAAIGSAIAADLDSAPFEVGGRVNPRDGTFEPVARGAAGLRVPVQCQYVAACSALVRASAVRATGLLPDVFLNADDVEWFIRLRQATGGRVAAHPLAVTAHPRFDRFQTWARYYIARNSFGPIEALGLGPRVRFGRALREVARALGQVMLGRDDLAALHLRGLADARAGRRLGPGPAAVLAVEAFRPWGTLADAVERELGVRTRRVPVFVARELGLPPPVEQLVRAQLRRAGLEVPNPPSDGTRPPISRIWPRRPGLAVVAARGRPASWLRGRLCVLATPQGFVIRRPRPIPALARAAATLARGLWLALRLAARPLGPTPLPAAPLAERPDTPALARVGVVVLSYNRWPALERTLEHLLDPAGLALGPGQVLVVDNGSKDGTPARVRERFPGCGLAAEEKNLGVEAFNRGATRSAGDLLLILDDDARPDPDSLRAAARLLLSRPDLAAVTLNPVHPRSGRSEWRFARAAGPGGDDSWPVMGCCNLVRRDAWQAAGGYERDYFLYRNDTDLALKLLAMGRGVHFNPSWTCAHDSPAASAKSPRWHRLATRNWVWTCRRHAPGPIGLAGSVLGWAWAHRLAGFSPRRHLETARGALGGLAGPPPRRPAAVPARPGNLGRLLRLQLGGRA